MARYHDPKVRHRSFQPNDLVLRRAEVSVPEMARGKFAPTWEGPYLVKEVFLDGSCKLSTLDEQEFPRRWHLINLRRYYSLSIYFLT